MKYQYASMAPSLMLVIFLLVQAKSKDPTTANMDIVWGILLGFVVSAVILSAVYFFEPCLDYIKVKVYGKDHYWKS
ncbi:MAG: hypothetical protein ACOYLO_00035 [Ferruginibacter sp.]